MKRIILAIALAVTACGGESQLTVVTAEGADGVDRYVAGSQSNQAEGLTVEELMEDVWLDRA